MRAMCLLGYRIEYMDMGDAGQDASAPVAPSERLQQKGQSCFGWAQ